MTRQISYRTADLEHSEGRTVYGLAVPYDQVVKITEINGYSFKEKFTYRSFARSITERGHKVKLLNTHNSRVFPIGKASLLREETRGLYAEFEVAKTAAGDEALELVRSGVVDSFSVGFSSLRDRWDDDVLVRLEARLNEVSLVAFPAYETALIDGVRSGEPFIPHDAVARRLRALDI